MQRKQLQQRRKLVNYLTMGYRFLKWIENQLPNRTAKKAFFRRLIKDGLVDNKYIDRFANQLYLFEAQLRVYEDLQKKRKSCFNRIQNLMKEVKRWFNVKNAIEK